MNAVGASGQPVNPWLIAMVVSLATFMEVLDTTITNVSLTHIAGNLSAGQEESTWVLTSYLVANGIALPISGWLSNVFGRKRYFLMCIAGFTFASFLCGASTSLGMLIVSRLLQGFAGGGLQPTQQAIILDAFPPEKRGTAFGLAGITLIAAPIIGPTLGGWITDNYSWRWIFFINLPVGLFAMYAINKLLHEQEHSKARGAKHIDAIGLGMIVLGFGALQIMLDKGQQEDWFDSNFIICAALISFSAITAAVIWMLRQSDPIVDLRLLGKASFGIPCILIFFTGFALYGSSALLPLMLQSHFGYNATLAGLVLSPGGLAVIFLMPLSGKLVAKYEARYLVMIGLSLCAAGMWYTSFITPQTDYNTFVWMRVVQVLGLPFLFIPVSNIAFADIPKEKSNKASALFSLSRNLGGSVGIAIVIFYLSRHSQVHQAYLSEHLVPGDSVYESTLYNITHTLMGLGYTAASAAQSAMGMMYQQLLKQSSILAYHDAFIFMMFVMLSGLVLTLALPRTRPNKADPALAH